MKLPILYLIDSIVKNVGGVYIKYFSQTIVKIFIGAFEKVIDGLFFFCRKLLSCKKLLYVKYYTQKKMVFANYFCLPMGDIL